MRSTSKLASRLGRKPADIMANGNANALEQLLVEPFSQLHRALLQVCGCVGCRCVRVAGSGNGGV